VTPSGISLAPEGGAHQSVATPLIGLGQPELLSFEPAYADELAEILRFAFAYLQSDDGSSVYLRLSTRTVEQPERAMTEELKAAILAGGIGYASQLPGQSSPWSAPARFCLSCSRQPTRSPTICRGSECS
jgi:pyruvate dehydrogenase E1 component